MLALKLLFSRFNPENKMRCVVFTVIYYICYTFWPDTSDFIKGWLSYTLMSGIGNELQIIFYFQICPCCNSNTGLKLHANTSLVSLLLDQPRWHEKYIQRVGMVGRDLMHIYTHSTTLSLLVDNRLELQYDSCSFQCFMLSIVSYNINFFYSASMSVY